MIGQSKSVDLEHIKTSNNAIEACSYDKQNNTTYMNVKQKSILSKYNPITLSISMLMYFYQNVISPQLSSNCQYELSCSNFSKHAIKEFGLIKGIFLSSDRLLTQLENIALNFQIRQKNKRYKFLIVNTVNNFQ